MDNSNNNLNPDIINAEFPSKKERNELREKEIKEYIVKHNITKNVSEMLNSAIHKRNENPYIFMIKYLQSLIPPEVLKKNNIWISSPSPEKIPIVFYPKFKSNSYLQKHLDKLVWNKIKYNKTTNDTTINDLTRLTLCFPNDKIGCVITEEECLQAYEELLIPLIADVHNININEFISYDTEDFEMIDLNNNNSFNTWKHNEKWVYFRLEYYRNIQGYLYNIKRSLDAMRDISIWIKDKIIRGIERKIIPEGDFYNFDSPDKDEVVTAYNIINDDWQFNMELMMKMEFDVDWGKYRSVFMSKDKSVHILINFVDHLTVYIQEGVSKTDKDDSDEDNNANNSKEEDESSNDLNSSSKINNWTLDSRKKDNVNKINIFHIYNKGVAIMKYFNWEWLFSIDKKFGYWTTFWDTIGAGWIIKSDVEISKKLLDVQFTKEITQAPKIVKKRMKGNSTNMNKITTTINEIIQGQRPKFFSFVEKNSSIDTAILHREITYKLMDWSSKRFLNNYICLDNALHNFDDALNEGTLDFTWPIDNISATIKDANVKNSYLSSYEFLSYTFSPLLKTLNHLINANTPSKLKCKEFYWTSKIDYIIFYRFIYCYLILFQNFNTNLKDHINKPEVNTKAIIENQIHSENWDRYSNLQITWIRNFDHGDGIFSRTQISNNNAEIEKIIISSVDALNSTYGNKYATYISLSNPSTREEALNWIKGNNLPYNINNINYENKGIIKFSTEDVFAIVNEDDHIKFVLVIIHPRETFVSKFESLIMISNAMSIQAKYLYDNKFGFWTSSLNYVGSGMSVKIDIKLANCKNRDWESTLDGSVRKKMFDSELLGKKDKYSVFKIWNKYTIGYSEFDILMNLVEFTNDILGKDKLYGIKEY